MEETEGMEAGSHTLWESNCSLISQANIPGKHGDAMQILFSTWAVGLQSDDPFDN